MVRFVFNPFSNKLDDTGAEGGVGGALTSLTGNSGDVVSGDSSANINIKTANSTVTFIGVNSTSTITEDFGLTNLLLGSSGPSIAGATHNTALGLLALSSITNTSESTAVGWSAGSSLTGGLANTFIGSASGILATTGGSNTAIGASSFASYTTGAAGAGSNTVVGASSVTNLATGIFNTVVGATSGNALTTSESSNILIRNTGTILDNNTIRIGTQGTGSGQQNKTFVAGIYGTTVAGPIANIDSTGKLGQLAEGTLNQVLTSAGAGASPTWNTSTVMVWSVVTVDGTFSVNTGVIANKAGLLSMALPTTAAVGSMLSITGINTALGWKITQTTGQQIFFGTSNTASGATGSLSSVAIRDTVTMVCVVANTTWNVISSVGNINIV